MRKPAVLSFLVLVHEADPVIHATVGATRAQQTVDKCLLKPASMKQKTGVEMREVLPQRKNTFLEQSTQKELPALHGKKRSLAVIPHHCILMALLMAGYRVARMTMSLPTLKKSTNKKSISAVCNRDVSLCEVKTIQ